MLWSLRCQTRACRHVVHNDELWRRWYTMLGARMVYTPPLIRSVLASTEPRERARLRGCVRPQIGQYFNAFVLARMEAERTDLAADELCSLTFWVRHLRLPGRDEANLQTSCPWWRGEEPPMECFDVDGTVRRHQPRPSQPFAPPREQWASVGSWRFVPTPAGFPHDPMRRYICTVGLDRRTLFPTTFYQVRRDARWGWLLVTAHAIKACFRPPVRHSSGRDAIEVEAAQFFSASEATSLMNAARIANEDAAAGLWQCPVCTFGGNASQASCCEVCTSSRQ
eukprot:COSAG04_NODE_106_length_25980_cov_446.060160_11_plen_281_part_00